MEQNREDQFHSSRFIYKDIIIVGGTYIFHIAYNYDNDNLDNVTSTTVLNKYSSDNQDCIICIYSMAV